MQTNDTRLEIDEKQIREFRDAIARKIPNEAAVLEYLDQLTYDAALKYHDQLSPNEVTASTLWATADRFSGREPMQRVDATQGVTDAHTDALTRSPRLPDDQRATKAGSRIEALRRRTDPIELLRMLAYELIIANREFTPLELAVTEYLGLSQVDLFVPSEPLMELAGFEGRDPSSLDDNEAGKVHLAAFMYSVLDLERRTPTSDQLRQFDVECDRLRGAFQMLPCRDSHGYYDSRQ